jgi:hypothetical protein
VISATRRKSREEGYERPAVGDANFKGFTKENLIEEVMFQQKLKGQKEENVWTAGGKYLQQMEW